MKRLLQLALLIVAVQIAPALSAQDNPEPTAPPTELTGDSERDPSEMTREERLNRPIPDYRDAEDGSRPEVNTMGLLFRTLGSLLVVVGLAMVLGYLAKRMMPARFGGGTTGDHLKIVQTLPLGPRRFVSLIEADGQRLLIGVTDHRIELIKALDESSFGETFADVEEPKRVRELEESL